jgi:hypothetical protein
MSIKQREENIKQLEDWLRQDKYPVFFERFISLFGFGSKTIPTIISNPLFSEIQTAWKQDSVLWRQFKQKMYSLLQDQKGLVLKKLLQPIGTKSVM